MENPIKIIEVTVTPELCNKYGFSDIRNCALSNAIKEITLDDSISVGIDTGNSLTYDFRIVPDFDYRAFKEVLDTATPFRCLIIPDENACRR